MQNTKRILFNTGVMYIKMFITIVLSLYTSRVVLEALGVIDFGIYSVVASVVALFGFLNASMIASVQRHLAFEIGKKNVITVRKIFNAGLMIHVCLAIGVFILAESVGIWFVKSHLTIPPERLDAAVWAFHFAMLSFVCTIISVPFQAMLNAKEFMVVIAVVGVVEAVLQLTIALMISDSQADRLTLYAALLSCVFFISLLIYSIFCYTRYKECKLMVVKEKSLYKELTGFAGWNLFGTLAVVGRTQGVVILLNIFLGPAINAAYAVANRINSQLSFFSMSVSRAISPQIVKNYGAGNRSEFLSLVFQSSKFTFCMLFLVSVPVLLEAEFILNVWLVSVPDYAVLFSRLIIINSLLDSLAAALIDAALASGKIRNYQMIVGSAVLLNVPFSYIALKSGAEPYSVLVICIMMSMIATALRLRLLNIMIKFPVIDYMREVLARLMIIVIITLACTVPIISGFEEGVRRFMVMLFISTFVSFISIYFIGLKSNERDYIKKIFKRNS